MFLNVLLDKFKEVLYSILPITVIVLILNFTFVPLGTTMLVRFLLGALLITIGLTIFLMGVDLGITPVGKLMGASLAKSNKVMILVFAGLLLGFVVSIAEPDLHILAGQVDMVTAGEITKWLLVIVVSVGIGVLLAAGLLRILFNVHLYKFLTVIYAIIFIVAIFATPEFMAIAFDASGATTGALTVPFVLALALGVSNLKKDSKAAEKDSFGLVGIISAGAILAVLLMSIIRRTGGMTGVLEKSTYHTESILGPFLSKTQVIAIESAVALLPLFIIFIIAQMVAFKLKKKQFGNIMKGFLYGFIGLTLFLTGVNAGFMDVGAVVGREIAAMGSITLVVIVGFVLGFVTILAEPAVYVLTHQIEDVTSGYVKRKLVTMTLSIGVGAAVALSMLRIVVPGIQLWHYLLPGYIISIIMSFFSPDLFVGIAFDSGGVASGPMTATFILAFAQGAADAIEGANILSEGFGMIAMVALTPLIALQILGLIYKAKSHKGGLTSDGKHRKHRA
jgi:hypothetical protein